MKVSYMESVASDDIDENEEKRRKPRKDTNLGTQVELELISFSFWLLPIVGLNRQEC